VSILRIGLLQHGYSCAFSPIAFDEKGSRDTTVPQAGAEEGVYLAPFDLEALRDWRDARHGATPSAVPTATVSRLHPRWKNHLSE